MKTLLALLLLIPSLTWGNHLIKELWDNDIGGPVPFENKCDYDDSKDDFFNYLKEIKSCDTKTGLDPASNNDYIDREFYEVFLANHIQKPLKVYMGMTLADENEGLIYHLKQVLGGPSDEVKLIDDRYLIFSGCRYQSCPEKGFLWIDTEDKKIIATINHYFFEESEYISDSALTTFTNDFQSEDDLPNSFKTSLNNWLSVIDVSPSNFYFIGSDNHITFDLP